MNQSSNTTEYVLNSPTVEFKVRPSLFLLFLLLLLLCNLFTWMLRRFKNSILEINQNLIIVINSYIVELINLIVMIHVSFQVTSGLEVD